MLYKQFIFSSKYAHIYGFGSQRTVFGSYQFKNQKSNLKPFYSNASNTSFYPPFLYLNNLLFYYNWSSLLWCFGLNSLARSFQFSFVRISISVGSTVTISPERRQSEWKLYYYILYYSTLRRHMVN